MGLWIRSQDELILKYCTTLYIVTGGTGASIKSDASSILGSYETQEQAIYVLDTIEDHFNNEVHCVFNMPSIDEVRTQIAELTIYITTEHK